MDRARSRRSPEPHRRRERYNEERRNEDDKKSSRSRRSRSRERRRRSRSRSRSGEREEYRSSSYRSSASSRQYSDRHGGSHSYGNKIDRTATLSSSSHRRRSSSRDRFGGNEDHLSNRGSDGIEHQRKRQYYEANNDYNQDYEKRVGKSQQSRRMRDGGDYNDVMIATSTAEPPPVRVQQPLLRLPVASISSPTSSCSSSTTASARAAAAASVAASIANGLALSSAASSSTSHSNLTGTAGGSNSTIPAYYNASKVNAVRLADQQAKRRLLWGDSSKSTQPNERDSSNTVTSANGSSASISHHQSSINTSSSSTATSSTAPTFFSSSSSSKVWNNLTFQGEHGLAMTEKFRKLMGIKHGDSAAEDTNGKIWSSASSSAPNSRQQSSDKLFDQLDAQYEQARAATHTNRGMGLGYK